MAQKLEIQANHAQTSGILCIYEHKEVYEHKFKKTVQSCMDHTNQKLKMPNQVFMTH